MTITASQLNRLNKLIESGDTHLFYCWGMWKAVTREVKQLDNRECQHCKAKGRYRRGVIVHHVKHLRDRPDLALSIYDPETGERQLVLLCKQCHEDEHPESLRPQFAARPALTSERWD